MQNASDKLSRSIVILISAVVADPTLATEQPANTLPPIRITKMPEGYLFEEDRERILFYQIKTKSLRDRFPRANYIHPLYDLDENILTEDFPKDHLHQRGIFWAWHQLRVDGRSVADPWLCRNIAWKNVGTDITANDDLSSTFHVTVQWKCPLGEGAVPKQSEWRAVVEETTRIRVYRRTERMRKIDIELRLLALVDNLTIGGSEDEKGYGGFSARLRLPRGLRFTGRHGPLKPQRLALDAGPWVDFSAAFGRGENVSGLAILGHPSLPQFPPRWALREKGSMQNPIYPGRTVVRLSRAEPTVLRYRLIVHRGDAEQLDLGELQRAYASGS